MEISEKDKSREMKQRRWRGKNEERACSKMTKGVVVGRSKAVKVNDWWFQIDCTKPPDVIAPPYSFEVKNKKFPKTVASAMAQAVKNCPQGLTPKLWWRDRETGARYIIELLPDFLGDHIG